ncbi:cardiolipin synthase [Corticibacter populi]|uniref:Cardiolipin synthase n=1 Tax=Corticibacter populi TaxID=1550736 RepID=A0A3M6QZA6_9BURK|nr:phospholipase D-like domain-containing protein [Corticibacter populi]RMX08271.1 cardiolipin synthase [Corticibacter populi]RZS35549.1 cardiolipin synthase [Corticibacter populi]
MYALPLSLGHISLVCIGLLTYVLTNRINHSRRPPGSAVAWVLLIVAFPYLGLPLYLLFGSRKLVKALPVHQVHWSAPKPDRGLQAEPRWAHEVLVAVEAPPVVLAPELHFEADGRIALLGVLDCIDAAEHELCVCTFVLGNDEVASRIIDALVVAVHRGVRVRLLIDAIGSLALRRARMQLLLRNGVELRRFMPIFRNPVRGRTNLRNHRKCIIVDGRRVWTGGRNLAAEYYLDQPMHPAWLDMSFQATGPIAEQFLAIFESDWAQASQPLLWGQSKATGQSLAHGAIDAFYRLQDTWHHVADLVKASMPGYLTPGSAQTGDMAPQTLQAQTMQLIPSGPDYQDDTIYTLLLTGFFQARHSITIVTPYFVPDDTLTAALTLAARRGVRVQLLIPKVSNHRLADIARMRPLRLIAQAGGEVYWIAHMAHAKAFIIDEQIAMSGSANLDTRSMFLNYEMMAAFYSPEAIASLTQWARQLQAASTRYEFTPPGFARDVLEGLVRAVAFEL